MTREQERKAYAALLQKTVDDLYKHAALDNHNTAAEWVTRYHLPYRVSLDYLKKPIDKTVVRINDAYPMPGYPISEVVKIPIDDLYFDDRYTVELEDGRKKIIDLDYFGEPTPEYKVQIQAVINRLRPLWYQDTVQGRQEWERIFAHYLTGYDYTTFSYFDMFGRADGTREELTAAVDYYTAVVERYHKGGNYLTEPPPYLPEYADQYTTHEYIIQWRDNL